MSKVLYGITAVILAALLAVLAYQTQRLGEAKIRAVEAAQLAQQYKGSLESLAAAVEAGAKSEELAKKALEARAKQAQALAAKTKKENDALKEALTRSPDWASEPIPSGVLDALRN